MRSSRLIVVTVILLLAVSSVIVVSRVQAADLEVGPGKTYATIAAALLAPPSPSDRILVYPGTYVGDLTISIQNLVLQSVNKWEAVIQGSITVTATGVTVDGFRIQTSGSQDGIYLAAGAETVTNNLIEGPIPIPSSGQQGGIRTGGCTTSATCYVLRGNTIMNFRYGMNLDGNHADPPSIIDGNHISNALVTGIILQVGLTGFGDYATITNNLIEDSGSGMVLGNAYYKVSGNIIRNNAGSGIYIYAWYLTYGIQIECNLIENNPYGIYLDFDPQYPPDNSHDNVAHNNNIVGSTKYDVYSVQNGVFDATSNWWGSPSGPSKIFGKVLYDPWLTGCSTCPEPPSAGCPAAAAVGGCVQPVNTFALLSPWLVAIGLIGCVGTVVVVAKRRES